MVKTTLYLPEELKESLENLAAAEERTEADLVREALTQFVGERNPRPRLPLYAGDLGDPEAAEKVDELLEGFGR